MKLSEILNEVDFADKEKKKLKRILRAYNVKTKEDALIEAAERGTLSFVKFLINQGADVNANSWSDPEENAGWTALMAASYYDHKEIVELLLKNGANVNAKDNKNQTALMVASNMNNKKIVDLLKKYGAKE